MKLPSYTDASLASLIKPETTVLRELVVPFKAKPYEFYYCWGARHSDEFAVIEILNNDALDLLNYSIGNMFRSYEECMAHPEIRTRLENLRKELVCK